MSSRLSLRIVAIACALLPSYSAVALDSKVQSQIDKHIQEVQKWSGQPAIVAAVRKSNTQKNAEEKAMTQEAWSALPVQSAFVRRLTMNEAAEALKARRDEVITEAFISAADGTKVAFLAKPTNWSHKGKPKHDVPMRGNTWQGKVEVDESTKYEQIQIAVPILADGKPIGSLVVGMNIAKLAH